MNIKNAERPPSSDEWKEAYEQAIIFKEIAPWDWMFDSNLFGVQNPVNGEVGYCCVLGALGQVFGLAVYLGDEGLGGYFEGIKRHRSRKYDDILHLKKCLLLTYEKRSYLDRPDLEVIKNLGLTFNGPNAWPFFRNYKPGYYPWYLTVEEVRYLTVCLKEANEMVLRFKARPSLFDPPHPGSYLVRTGESLASGRVWKDAWLKPAPLKEMILMVKRFDSRRLQNITRGLSRAAMTWEVDFFYAPAVVGEKGRRPYFPTTLLFVDQHSYFILNTHMSEPDQYPVTLHEKLLETIEKARIIPQEIHVHKKDLSVYLAPLVERLGIRVRLVKKLPAVEEAHKGMLEFFGKQK